MPAIKAVDADLFYVVVRPSAHPSKAGTHDKFPRPDKVAGFCEGPQA